MSDSDPGPLNFYCPNDCHCKTFRECKLLKSKYPARKSFWARVISIYDQILAQKFIRSVVRRSNRKPY